MKQSQMEVNKCLMEKKILSHPKKQKQTAHKSHRRRTRTSKQVKIIETPMETHVHESIQEPLQEMVEESQRPLETTPLMVPNSISKLTKENWVKSLWEEAKKANEIAKNKEKAPIAKVDLNKK